MTASELKAARKRLGLNQRDFGLGLGLAAPQIQVSQLESGLRPISKRLWRIVELWERCNRLESTGGNGGTNGKV